MNNNLQGIENSPIFQYLNQFSGMVARVSVIGVQNPQDPSDERTAFDEGESERPNNNEEQ